MPKTSSLIFVAFVHSIGGSGCGAGPGETGPECTMGESIECACPNGLKGAQRCASGERYEACVCSPTGAASGAAGSAGGPPAGAKRVFVSSQSYHGDLRTLGGGATGLEGADNLCTQLANREHLGGTWKAYLTDSKTYAPSRMADVGPWYLLDGRKAFHSLPGVQGNALAVLDINEAGNSFLSPGRAWVGEHWTYGSETVDRTCGDWTRGSESSGLVGEPLVADRWMGVQSSSASISYCDKRAQLYCFEQ